MINPQQPELARNRKGATSQDSAKTKADESEPTSMKSGPEGPVPEDNQPGHHPEVEQDKPSGPP